MQGHKNKYSTNRADDFRPTNLVSRPILIVFPWTNHVTSSSILSAL